LAQRISLYGLVKDRNALALPCFDSPPPVEGDLTPNGIFETGGYIPPRDSSPNTNSRTEQPILVFPSSRKGMAKSLGPSNVTLIAQSAPVLSASASSIVTYPLWPLRSTFLVPLIGPTSPSGLALPTEFILFFFFLCEELISLNPARGTPRITKFFAPLPPSSPSPCATTSSSLRTSPITTPKVWSLLPKYGGYRYLLCKPPIEDHRYT